MTPEERLAFALAEIQREIASLQLQLMRLQREVQTMTDIWRNCACFGGSAP